MKNLTKTFLIALIMVVSFVNAQDANSLKVFLKPVLESGEPLVTRDKTVLSSDDTYNSVTYVLSLTSTVNLLKFHVKLGDTEGGNEKLEVVLNSDGTSLPDGITVEKKENRYYLTLGHFNGMKNFYSEVKVEDTIGVGPAIEFIK